MHYVYGYCTDKGTVKRINQDAMLVMEGETEYGPLLLAAVSDGMGGLAHGETASEIMIQELAKWAEGGMPGIRFSPPPAMKQFRKSMFPVIREAHRKIAEYAESIGEACGTTLTACLVIGLKWYTLNIGDSRMYVMSGGALKQITKDQTYVQYEMDCGRMTAEEAAHHKMRNILLQCIGASETITPDWYEGTVAEGDGIMLCSDGFRHILSAGEMGLAMTEAGMDDRDAIRNVLENCMRKSMEAGERDNITAVYVTAAG